MNIYVSNLSFNIHDEDLKALFIPFGEVSSAKIINDRESGRSRGFGFVEMTDDTASKKAIAELDGTTVGDRMMKVMEAKPKESRPARSDNSFPGNSGGGYNKGNRY